MSDQPPKPHKPISNQWTLTGFTPRGITWIRWKGVGLYYAAISSVVLVKEAHHARPNYQWIVSFSRQCGRGPERIPNKVMAWIKDEWNLNGWEEDNHEPGCARKFWLPVEEELRGVECPCKDETVVVEGDYQYSIKKPLVGERKSDP